MNIDIGYVILNIILALCIAVPMGWFHEYLHMRKAKQLGLTVTRPKAIKNQILVDTKDPVFTKQIGDAPYKIIIPLSIILLIIGVYFLQLGLIMGSAGTILIHMISYPLEGRDEEVDEDKSESN